MTNLSPRDRLEGEFRIALTMESLNIRRGKNGLAGLPEFAIPTITYQYPARKGGMIKIASFNTGGSSGLNVTRNCGVCL